MHSFLPCSCKILNSFTHHAPDLDTPRILCQTTWHINVTSLNINIIFVLRNLTLVTSLYSLFCGIKPVVSSHLSLSLSLSLSLLSNRRLSFLLFRLHHCRFKSCGLDCVGTALLLLCCN